jgi:DNA mismatch repair protein MutS2
MTEMEKRKQPQAVKYQLKAGDWVRLKNSQSTGKLEAINGRDAVVTMGGVRVKTKVRKLEKVTDPGEIQKASYHKVVVHYERKSVEPRLDIHGLRAREAIKKVTRYLDNAVASNRDEVEIMHGKGTGVLKKLVHEYLDERNEVKSYRLAPPARGGAGCTIVSL